MPVRTDLQLFADRLISRSALSADDLQAVLELPQRIERVKANHDVIGLDDTPDTICVVIAGLIARFDQSADGERQLTAFHIPGDAVDLLSGVLPSAQFGISALSACVIAHIPRGAIGALMTDRPELATAFLRDAAVDASVLSRWLVNIGHRDARTRIAHLLCEMAMRYKATRIDGSVVYNLPLTQSYIADATGLTSVHVNRTLKHLSSEDLATMRGGVVRIKDWAGLANAGMFTRGYLHVGSAVGLGP